MTPMPFERLTIQAGDDETATEWLYDLASVLAWYYPEEDAKSFQAALSARLRRPDIRPSTAEDGGMYFVQLLERTRSLAADETLPTWLVGVPLLEVLLQKEVLEVQLVERLVLPNPVDVPG